MTGVSKVLGRRGISRVYSVEQVSVIYFAISAVLCVLFVFYASSLQMAQMGFISDPMRSLVGLLLSIEISIIYVLAVALRAWRSFRPFKIDLILFVARFLAGLVLLFCSLSVVRLLFSGMLIWASILITVVPVTWYVFKDGLRMRLRLRTRSNIEIVEIGASEEIVPLSLDSELELLLTGKPISSLILSIEESKGSRVDLPAERVYEEDQWQVGTIPIGKPPVTISIIYSKQKIRRFKVEPARIPIINNIIVDIIQRNEPKYQDASVEIEMLVDKILNELVQLVLDKYRSGLGKFREDSIRVTLDGRPLRQDLSLHDNGITENSKIVIYID